MTGVEAAAIRAAEVVAKWGGVRLWRWMRPDRSREALLGHADRLAETVRRRETVLRDQLNAGPDAVMQLEFQRGPQVRSGGGGDNGVLSNIGPYFRRLAPPQRLLVLGEAGAGKTVLAVLLLLEQLRDRAALKYKLRSDVPVPVRVNVAGWDGGDDFTRWLTSRLTIDYPLNPKVARALIDEGLILPILDGLDEMDPPDAKPSRARAALDLLNDPPWRNQTLVVMCRAGVYERIRELRGDAGLYGAAAITLQPLSPVKIHEHLDHYRDQLGIPEDAWIAVTDQVGHHPDGPLATALGTPWLLGLTTTALRGDRGTAAQLAGCRDTNEIRDLLFTALITAAIRGTPRTGPTRDYTERKVQTGMHTLAEHLERQRTEGVGGVEISLGEVWALSGTRRCPALHALGVGVAVALAVGFVVWLAKGRADGGAAGLVFGVAFGLLAGFMPGLPVGPRVNITFPTFAERVAGRFRGFAGWGGLMAGLMYHVPFGLLAGLAVGLTANVTAPKRFAWRVPGRSRWRSGLAVGTAAGLVAGFVVGHFAGRTDGLLNGLAFGLLIGLMNGLRTSADDRLALGQDAGQVIHDDLVAALTVGLMSGLLFGLAQMQMQMQTHRLMVSLATGLATGLVFGLLGGLMAGRHATASLLFAFTGDFPARPVQFLEWARRAGLLRVTGIAYQFRHDTYQQWLAARDDDRGVKTTVDP